MKFENTLWVEMARPKTIDDLILPPEIKNALITYRNNKDIPHMLLAGLQGSGKTSTAKAMCNDLEADMLYINASSENSVDILRNRVVKFASSRGVFDNNIKVIVLDEADFLTPQFQAGLRGVMEEFSAHCRFILTCNYVNRLIEPLRSRCAIFDFNFSNKTVSADLKKKMSKRAKSILKLKECVFNDDVIDRLIEDRYPDFRSVLNTLQKFAVQNNNVIDESVFNFQSVGNEFYEYILKKDVRSARKYIIENSGNNFDEWYSNLYNEYLPMIEDNEVRYAKSLILIADYMYRSAFVVDKEINMAACIEELARA